MSERTDQEEILPLLLRPLVAVGVTIRLTFHTQGLLMSGVLISEGEYLKRLLEQVIAGTRAAEGEQSKAVAEGLEGLRAQVMALPEEVDGTAPFLHFRDVRIHYGVGTDRTATLWRVRSSAIDGISLESLDHERRFS
ncbi:hypothetical protein [Chondromyces crocatus]|uniref:Gas vesicle protein n=1 Tax=Chondromyces crocatus TaxID=52 RepID=A0A0K1EDI2_CHOCO|nr:hypothetical protein [Chondromyces crocatus]AKT38935.1 uncharacterized protein CMC5_030820 [Chondromyces crocatus]